MERKPIVTFSGNLKLFGELQNAISQGLPQECVEWRRSYGRTPKPVVVEVNFTKFNEGLLLEKRESLLGHPFLHTYWIECSDIESYKQNLRSNISDWMSCLKNHNVQDWMVVIVEHMDNKKVNKTKLLTRTSVVEKIKSDFPSKNGERCISLLDPFRSDARAAVSLNELLQRLRHLLLQAYNLQLNWYEDHVRAQREKRNEVDWDFLKFFFLQEELAYVFEMMGVYDDALVQYDELDALFSQFVINSSSGEMPGWLNLYTKSCHNWPGLCLLRENLPPLRKKLFNRLGSLLDLRSYLFARQCLLLLLLCRPWEMAQRSLPFLHNCVNELNLLEVHLQAGATATWVFLSCLEILQSCERFSDSSQVEAYSFYTVDLWAYAREKLHELGVSCGLIQEEPQTSEQVHLVMLLTSGMSEETDDATNPPNRQSRLREALSSKKAFLTQYLEISELTMGTYKHIGRIRSARLIGKDLASLYFQMGQREKAASFLNDMLQIYYRENWQLLIGQTQIELASYYKVMEDKHKYIKTCLKLSANDTLKLVQRLDYLKEIERCKKEIPEKERVTLRTERIFIITNTRIDCQDDVPTSESKVKVILNLKNLLPTEIQCNYIKITLSKEASSSRLGVRLQQQERMAFEGGAKLDFVLHHDKKDDGALLSKVYCRNVHQALIRRDSHGVSLHSETKIREDEQGIFFNADNVCLVPGDNKLSFEKTGLEAGVYRLSQLSLTWDNVLLLYSYSLPAPSFVLVYEPPSVNLQSLTPNPIAGIVQGYELVIFSGSNRVPENTVVSVESSSQGLHIIKDGNDDSNSAKFDLPCIKRFDTIRIPFCVLAEFGPQRDASMVDYRVTLKWTLSCQSITVTLNFIAPFMTAHKLHTCNDRKFLQVFVHGLTQESFVLGNPLLICQDENCSIGRKPLNPSFEKLSVNVDQTGLLLWELLLPNNCTDFVPCCFLLSLDYYSEKDVTETSCHYRYDFKLGDFRTQFAVRALVEPPEGSEFCRAGTLCPMKIKIERLEWAPFLTLMYEVIADQSMWSVCGKTAGVVCPKEEPFCVTLEVMPLVAGFLPLPTVRLSKYIPDEQPKLGTKDTLASGSTVKLEPFNAGLVYSWSRAMQAHVLPNSNASSNET